MTATNTAETKPDRRRRLRSWLLLLVIPVVAVVWWLGSPLFLDDTVDEAFPPVVDVDDTQVTSAGEAGAGESDVEDAAGGETEADAAAGTAGSVPTQPEALSVGTFAGFDAVHEGQGAAGLYDLGDSVVLRFEEFEVTNGPDLRVNLVLGDGSMVDIGALKGNIGDQNYEVPVDVDVDAIAGVLIYCRAFSVPFAEADLS